MESEDIKAHISGPHNRAHIRPTSYFSIEKKTSPHQPITKEKGLSIPNLAPLCFGIGIMEFWSIGIMGLKEFSIDLSVGVSLISTDLKKSSER